MKAIDLFAGVGGLSLGFIQAGVEIVYANEHDVAIAASYKKNHPNTIVDSSDIRDIDLESKFAGYRGNVDIVMGGPPCQGFSQKGQRIGIADERNYLFRQFIEVVKIVSPSFVLIENVPNLLSSQQGFFKQEIINLLESLGYKVEVAVLKAEQFGVPQKRRRAVIFGQKPGNNVQLPTGTDTKTTVYEAIGDLPKLRSGGGEAFVPYARPAQSVYQRMMRKNSKGVSNHIATNHSPVALTRLALIPVGGTKEHLPPEHRTKSIHSGTWSRLPDDGFAPTITTRFDTPSSGQFTLATQDRCITVREAARLQSFPDNFVFIGSKSNQMLQVGNAVPPLLARALAENIVAGAKN